MSHAQAPVHRSPATTSSLAAGGRRRPHHRRLGAAAVEFAVVVPVFFLLVFGMIEFGRMVMVQQVLTNASREGCREGILDGATNSSVQSTVNNYLSGANINGATITVTPSDPGSAGAGDSVTVQVSVPYDNVSWMPGALFLGGKTLSASTVMRRETTQ